MSIFRDWRANKGNPKGRFVLVLFRIASFFSGLPKPLVYFAYPYLVFYRLVIEWILCVELPWRLVAGPGLRLFHGQALVVNDRVIIGQGCILRHSTTIGVSRTSDSFGGDAPRIGNFVDIGSNVVIVGNIVIGDHALIGAGAVVTKDVPAWAVVAGNPAIVLRIRPH